MISNYTFFSSIDARSGRKAVGLSDIVESAFNTDRRESDRKAIEKDSSVTNEVTGSSSPTTKVSR